MKSVVCIVALLVFHFCAHPVERIEKGQFFKIFFGGGWMAMGGAELSTVGHGVTP